MTFSGDRTSGVILKYAGKSDNARLVNQIGPRVGQDCGRKIGYWVQSVFSWTVRTL